MPELPEVQTVVNDLQIIKDDQIIDFWSDWERALKSEDGNIISAKEVKQRIVGKKIISIERLGKNITINLSNNISIFVHLRMTGQLLLLQNFQFPISNFQKKGDIDLKISENSESKYHKHIHHIFFLKKNGVLAFSDVRKFATIKVLPTDEIISLATHMAVDPISKDFALKTFKKLFERKYSKSIKEFLMDQSIILGIGNIYASEILFDTSINPARKIGSITIIEQKKLYHSIKKILIKAIQLRGTSVSDYRDSSGQKGSFQNMLKVYKKNKQKCLKCDTIIIRTVIGQRSTFHCPKCQR